MARSKSSLGRVSRYLVFFPAFFGFLVTSSSAEADTFGVWEFSKSCLAEQGGMVELVEGGFRLVGADGGTCAGKSHYVRMQATIPEDINELGFQWTYQTNDGSWYDPPQIILNGIVTKLTNENNATGSLLIEVEPGDVFAFRQFSTDSCCQPGLLTITNLTLDLGEWVSTTSSTTATTTSTSIVPSTTVPVTNPTTTTVQETTTTSTTSSLPQTSVPTTTTAPPQTSTTIQETVSTVTSTSSTTTTTVVQTTTPSSSSTTTPSSLPTTTTQAPTTTTSSLPPTTTTTSTTSTTSLPQTITGTTTTTTVYIPPATTTTVYIPPVTTTTEPIVEPSTTTTTTEPEPAPTTTAKPPLETTTSTTTNPPTTTTTQPPVTTTQPNVTTTLQAPTDEPKPLTQTELLNTIQALSEASTEAIQGIVAQTLTKELDTSQATLLIASPAVLENITPAQAEQLFEQITPTELSPDEAEAVVAAVQEAPEEVREAFESTLNIFQGFADTYVPLNSTAVSYTHLTLPTICSV